MKHLAFQIEKTTTSGTNWKKGTITKGKKTGKRSENTAIQRIQLVAQIATHRIAIALKYMLSKIVQQKGLDQVNWS